MADENIGEIHVAGAIILQGTPDQIVIFQPQVAARNQRFDNVSNCCATSAETSGQYSGLTLRPFAGSTTRCPSVRSKMNLTSGQNCLSASCGVKCGFSGLGGCRMPYSGVPMVFDACANIGIASGSSSYFTPI